MSILEIRDQLLHTLCDMHEEIEVYKSSEDPLATEYVSKKEQVYNKAVEAYKILNSIIEKLD